MPFQQSTGWTLIKSKVFGFLTLASLSAITLTSHAKADVLIKDGTAYSGRVVSLTNEVVQFDFSCSGEHQSLPMEVGMGLVIDFTCEINAPPEGMGGREPCSEPIPEREKLFFVSYSLTYQNQYFEGFGVFEDVIATDTDFGFSEEDLTLSEYHGVGITVVPGDACVALTAAEMAERGVELDPLDQWVFRHWDENEVVILCNFMPGC